MPDTFHAKPLGLRRTKDRTVIACPCGAVTDRGRRGLCPKCAVRACRGAELGDRCACCGHAVRAELCLRDVGGVRETLCGNCATRLGRRPLTLAQLRDEAGAAAA